MSLLDAVSELACILGFLTLPPAICYARPEPQAPSLVSSFF